MDWWVYSPRMMRITIFKFSAFVLGLLTCGCVCSAKLPELVRGHALSQVMLWLVKKDEGFVPEPLAFSGSIVFPLLFLLFSRISLTQPQIGHISCSHSLTLSFVFLANDL